MTSINKYFKQQYKTINSNLLDKWRNLIVRYLRITNKGLTFYVVKTKSKTDSLSEFIVRIDKYDKTLVRFKWSTQDEIKSIHLVDIIGLRQTSVDEFLDDIRINSYVRTL